MEDRYSIKGKYECSIRIDGKIVYEESFDNVNLEEIRDILKLKAEKDFKDQECILMWGNNKWGGATIKKAN